MERLNSLAERKKRHLELYTGVWVIMYLVVACGIYPGKMLYPLQAGMVPAAFAIMGLWLANMTEGGEKLPEIKDVAKGLLMPYLWFSLIWLLIYSAALMLDIGGRTAEGLTDGVKNTLTLYGNGDLWLLPAAFLAISIRLVMKKEFRRDIAGGVMLAVIFIAFLCIMHFTGFSALRVFEAGDQGIQGILVRLAMVVWRGVTGAFICFLGELMYGIYDRVRKKKLLYVIMAFALLAGGTALSIYTGRVAWEDFQLVNPLLCVPAGLAVMVGLYVLSIWIDTIPPLDFLGRHAMIVYICTGLLGGVSLAYYAYTSALAAFDNRFASSCIHAAVLAVCILILIFVFRNRALAFLFGYKTFEKPMVEADYDTYD